MGCDQVQDSANPRPYFRCNVAVVVLLGFIGAPQIAALFVLWQRGLEELYSARNAKALLAKGATEAGNIFYPVVAATHLAWIAALAFSDTA